MSNQPEGDVLTGNYQRDMDALTSIDDRDIRSEEEFVVHPITDEEIGAMFAPPVDEKKQSDLGVEEKKQSDLDFAESLKVLMKEVEETPALTKEELDDVLAHASAARLQRLAEEKKVEDAENAQKLEAEKIEAERLEAERVEAERLEAERVAAAEHDASLSAASNNTTSVDHWLQSRPTGTPVVPPVVPPVVTPVVTPVVPPVVTPSAENTSTTGPNINLSGDNTQLPFNRARVIPLFPNGAPGNNLADTNNNTNTSDNTSAATSDPDAPEPRGSALQRLAAYRLNRLERILPVEIREHNRRREIHEREVGRINRGRSDQPDLNQTGPGAPVTAQQQDNASTGAAPVSHNSPGQQANTQSQKDTSNNPSNSADSDSAEPDSNNRDPDKDNDSMVDVKTNPHTGGVSGKVDLNQAGAMLAGLTHGAVTGFFAGIGSLGDGLAKANINQDIEKEIAHTLRKTDRLEDISAKKEKNLLKRQQYDIKKAAKEQAHADQIIADNIERKKGKKVDLVKKDKNTPVNNPNGVNEGEDFYQTVSKDDIDSLDCNDLTRDHLNKTYQQYDKFNNAVSALDDKKNPLSPEARAKTEKEARSSFESYLRQADGTNNAIRKNVKEGDESDIKAAGLLTEMNKDVKSNMLTSKKKGGMKSKPGDESAINGVMKRTGAMLSSLGSAIKKALGGIGKRPSPKA